MLRRLNAVSVLPLALALSGCAIFTTAKPLDTGPLSPPTVELVETLSKIGTGPVYLDLIDGRRVKGDYNGCDNDFLYLKSPIFGKETAYAFSDIQTVRTQELNPLGLIVSGVLLAGVLVTGFIGPMVAPK